MFYIKLTNYVIPSELRKQTLDTGGELFMAPFPGNSDALKRHLLLDLECCVFSVKYKALQFTKLCHNVPQCVGSGKTSLDLGATEILRDPLCGSLIWGLRLSAF